MVNTRHKLQNPKQVLTPVVEEHPHKNRRSAIDYYGENYMAKLLKVTGGRVLHNYDKPRFTLPKKYRR